MSDERVISVGGVEGGVRARMARSPRRWALAGVGLACVAAGFVGVFLPGLPTTVFLIAASWCFVRSCPHLEGKLRESRVLGPYMRYVGEGVEMPRRVRAGVTVVMWGFIGMSVVLVCGGGEVGWWFGWVMGLVGVVGTVAVWRVGRCCKQ